MIGRRSAIAAGGLALASGLAHAQAERSLPVVGFLGFASEASDRASVVALRQGFAELGHVEGRTIVIESRHAEGHVDRVPALVAEMAARPVGVFVVPGQAAARLLHRITRIPIVAIGLPPTASDPDLFQSLSRPGGTVTGFSNFAEELAGKRIELMREVLPGLKAIGVLHNVVDPVFREWGVETEAAIRGQGLVSVRLGLTSVDPAEVVRLVRSLRPAGAEALIVIRDFLTHSVRDAIYGTAIEERIATVTEQRDFAEAGAFMSYGADMRDLFRRAAGYADRILKGDRPGDLPIQLATKLEFVVNQRTARAIGLVVPPSILLRADEVIE
ncbi:MAG: ABC transporter substrate-binding protein [Alphaproteobacteria bacterium]|nr:ABC transporter substrate-binding protein [Alphaproteobacteria bacterium]